MLLLDDQLADSEGYSWSSQPDHAALTTTPIVAEYNHGVLTGKDCDNSSRNIRSLIYCKVQLIRGALPPTFKTQIITSTACTREFHCSMIILAPLTISLAPSVLQGVSQIIICQMAGKWTWTILHLSIPFQCLLVYQLPRIKLQIPHPFTATLHRQVSYPAGMKARHSTSPRMHQLRIIHRRRVTPPPCRPNPLLIKP